jgi:hypothetical protein
MAALVRTILYLAAAVAAVIVAVLIIKLVVVLAIVAAVVLTAVYLYHFAHALYRRLAAPRGTSAP